MNKVIQDGEHLLSITRTLIEAEVLWSGCIKAVQYGPKILLEQPFYCS